MANTHFLLQQSFHPLKPRTFAKKWSCSATNKNNAVRSIYSPCKISPQMRMKCFIMNKNSHVEKKDISGIEVADDINVVIWRSIKNVIYALQKSVLSGALFVLLLSYDRRHALAASGGRMGGSSFSRSSSRSSSSTPSSSSSYYYSTQTSSPAPPMTEFEATLLLCLAIVVFLVFIDLIYPDLKREDATKTSILMLQVGLLGTAISLQKDLNRIAESADTSTSKGFWYILQEATLALLRYPNYCVSGYSSVDVKVSVWDGKKRFNKLSDDERGKFDEETMVNVNNVRKKSATSEKSKVLSNECIVVTIIVAARGIHKLPPIQSSAQLKEALQKLASIPSRNTMAAEVLWTPQLENDILTEQELLENYPLLHSF